MCFIDEPFPRTRMLRARCKVLSPILAHRLTQYSLPWDVSPGEEGIMLPSRAVGGVLLGAEALRTLPPQCVLPRDHPSQSELRR
eukprot:14663720-Alexandrium_andersonii.AAC.1